MRVVGRVKVTVDPSIPMGQRGLRWWGKWGRDSTVSPPVGNFVGGVSMRSPPTWNGGGNGSGRGCAWVPVVIRGEQIGGTRVRDPRPKRRGEGRHGGRR
jgi:hypothetical protein